MLRSMNVSREKRYGKEESERMRGAEGTEKLYMLEPEQS